MLNDAAEYPKLIKALRGPAFTWGFYDDVVLEGNADYKSNVVELNGFKWNFTQLLAHEMMHCFQFHKLGFFKSNPIAKIPYWKWEGYPEYIARQNADQKDLAKNIEHLISTEKTDNNNWITFSDGTGTVLPYYSNWILVQYCMDIKKMSYQQILKDTSSEENVQKQMMDWYLKTR